MRLVTMARERVQDEHTHARAMYFGVQTAAALEALAHAGAGIGGPSHSHGRRGWDFLVARL